MKKTFRVTVVQDMYQMGYVDIKADSAEEASGLVGNDEYFENIDWGEANDGGELSVHEVKEIV